MAGRSGSCSKRTWLSLWTECPPPLPTSAPGLGSPPPHLHRDRAYPHATSAPGLLPCDSLHRAYRFPPTLPTFESEFPASPCARAHAVLTQYCSGPFRRAFTRVCMPALGVNHARGLLFPGQPKQRNVPLARSHLQSTESHLLYANPAHPNGLCC